MRSNVRAGNYFGSDSRGRLTAMNGHEIAGSLIGVGGIGGVVTTFILGRVSREPEPEEAPKNEQKSNTPKSNNRKRRNR